MDPITIAMITQGLIKGGTALYSQAQETKSYYENTLSVLDAGAEEQERIVQETSYNIYRLRKEQSIAEGQDLAAMAASGGNLTGSNIDVMLAAERDYEFNADLAQYQGQLLSRNALIDTQNTLTGLRTGHSKSKINTTSSLLNAATSTYMSVNSYRQTDAYNKLKVSNQREVAKGLTELEREKTDYTYGTISIR